jgi:hypothetical protein
MLEFSLTPTQAGLEISVRDPLGRRDGAGQTLHQMGTGPLGKRRPRLPQTDWYYNYMGVLTFILSGAPIRYRTGHSKTRRFCA